jgi:hypothetical protein
MDRHVLREKISATMSRDRLGAFEIKAKPSKRESFRRQRKEVEKPWLDIKSKADLPSAVGARPRRYSLQAEVCVASQEGSKQFLTGRQM